MTSISLKDRVVYGAALLAVGVFLVFATGFSHSATIHNAAHDVRHSTAFPCH
ncbi:MAG TPA: CbtB-domain containing protein [Rhizobiales bacterium]|nr:CbtB-domain containing protein [Hyphomicrobiales bacterium]